VGLGQSNHIKPNDNLLPKILETETFMFYCFIIIFLLRKNNAQIFKRNHQFFSGSKLKTSGKHNFF
jgi:hypothetical protein